MAEEVVITASAEETIAWGREFAARLKAPVVVLLVRGIGQREDDADKGDCRRGWGRRAKTRLPALRSRWCMFMAAAAKVYHADLYRIENFHDFETLGMEDVFEKPAVVILEWAERFPLQSPWPQCGCGWSNERGYAAVDGGRAGMAVVQLTLRERGSGEILRGLECRAKLVAAPSGGGVWPTCPY